MVLVTAFYHGAHRDSVVIVMDNLWLPGPLNSLHPSAVAASADTRSHMLTVGTGPLIQQQQVQTPTRHQR